jgi:hypothetical protein
VNDLLKLSLGHAKDYWKVLTEVLFRPKAFLRSVSSDKERLNKSVVFFGLTALVEGLVSSPTMPTRANVEIIIPVLIIVSALIQLMMVAALKAAWKAVRGLATFEQLFVCTAFISGPGTLIPTVFFLSGIGIARIIDPAGAAYLRDHPMAPLPAESAATGASEISLAFVVLGVLVVSVWYFIAWGAYRELNGASRLQSAGAMVIMSPLFVLVITFAFLMNFAIMPM